MKQQIASLKNLESEGVNVQRLPFSIRILLENALRNHDGFAITDEHLDTLKYWKSEGVDKEIPFKPARILMQDFTGVPAVVDITSLRGKLSVKVVMVPRSTRLSLWILLLIIPFKWITSEPIIPKQRMLKRNTNGIPNAINY